jgi:putative FmdB family regulatory protein
VAGFAVDLIDWRIVVMPMYEYGCRNCGASFEKRLRIEERLTAQVCPHCDEAGAVLRMSAPALVGSKTSGGMDMGHCPTTGAPCGCANAIRN